MALRASGRAAALRRGARSRRPGSRASRTTTAASPSATRGGGSFVDETGAALQGLAAAGARPRPRRRARRPVAAAGAEPRRRVRAGEGLRSNAQSTAWAVQGIVAAGAAPGLVPARRAARRSRYLALAPAGATAASATRARRAQTPVWVTAQVVAALRRKTFPVRAPRAPPSARCRAALPHAPAPARKRRPARRREATRRQRADELGDATPVVERRSPRRRAPAAATPAGRWPAQRSSPAGPRRWR